MDFGLLFLGFSLFLIAAALVLVGLLVRLGLDRRASEIGLLLATGYRTRTVRRLLLAEGMIARGVRRTDRPRRGDRLRGPDAAVARGAVAGGFGRLVPDSCTSTAPALASVMSRPWSSAA